MRVVVTTPTGNIGSRAVQLLIQAGVRPTLLVRNPERLPDTVRSASEVLTGELGDREFILRATEGVDALFWLVPTDYTSNDPLGAMLQMGENAAHAVRTNGISRTVFLSSTGAERRGNDPISTLGRIEDLLNATEASVLHLRPGYFYTNLFMSLDTLRQGVLPTMLPIDMPMPWNDPRDIGEIVAARLLNSAWTGQNVQAINGPQHLSFQEVATIVSRTTGIPIQAISVTGEMAGQAMQQAGMSKAASEVMVEMYRGLAEFSAANYIPTYLTTAPTPLEAWCYLNLRPALVG